MHWGPKHRDQRPIIKRQHSYLSIDRAKRQANEAEYGNPHHGQGTPQVVGLVSLDSSDPDSRSIDFILTLCARFDDNDNDGGGAPQRNQQIPTMGLDGSVSGLPLGTPCNDGARAPPEKKKKKGWVHELQEL